MKIELTKKSILVITALLLIPTGMAFAAVVNGTIGNDILIGTEKKDKISGKEGSDLIFGFGNDGGGKAETLKGGVGDDEIVGDQDPLGLASGPLGAFGPDMIEGGNGDDIIFADGGNDEILEKAAGNDIVFGGAGDDGIDVGNGDDEVYGGTGNDVILLGNGNDVAFGNQGNDDITGGNGVDFIDCGEDPNGLDVDIARVTVGEDTWVNCEIVLDENTGDPITGGEVCGNNILEAGEQCDDGNTADGDGCSAVCLIEGAVCGNSIIEAGETCDDGNLVSGDGCSAICELETGPPSAFDNSALTASVQGEVSLANNDKNKLINILNEAQDAADVGDITVTCTEMEKFDNRLNRLIDRNKVDPLPGAGFITDSNVLQAEFCGTEADLELTKTVDNATPALENDPIMFTVTITNIGPDVATNVVVTDNLPFIPTTVTPSTGTSFGGSTWTVGTLLVGESATLEITGPAAASTLTVTNTAEITAADQVDVDSNVNNNVPAEDDQDSASATTA